MYRFILFLLIKLVYVAFNSFYNQTLVTSSLYFRLFTCLAELFFRHVSFLTESTQLQYVAKFGPGISCCWHHFPVI